MSNSTDGLVVSVTAARLYLIYSFGGLQCPRLTAVVYDIALADGGRLSTLRSMPSRQVMTSEDK